MLNIHENIKERLQYFKSIYKIPNIIFHGPSGGGKRTIVNDFIHSIYNNNRKIIKSFVMSIKIALPKTSFLEGLFQSKLPFAPLIAMIPLLLATPSVPPP